MFGAIPCRSGARTDRGCMHYCLVESGWESGWDLSPAHPKRAEGVLSWCPVTVPHALFAFAGQRVCPQALSGRQRQHPCLQEADGSCLGAAAAGGS